MHFLAFNLEKFTPDRFFYTGTARGARDKYEVWGKDATMTWSFRVQALEFLRLNMQHLTQSNSIFLLRRLFKEMI